MGPVALVALPESVKPSSIRLVDVPHIPLLIRTVIEVHKS